MERERLYKHFFVESGFFPEDGWFVPTDEKILTMFPRVKQNWDDEDWNGDWGFLLQKDLTVKYVMLCTYWDRKCKAGCYCVRPVIAYLESVNEEEYEDDYHPEDYATD